MQKKSTLIKKLASYSGLATTALLAAKSSEAQILYTDINPDVTTYNEGNYPLDLNNDGTTDFMFNLIHLSSVSGNQIRVVGYSSNSITRDLINFSNTFQNYAYANILNSGSLINSANAFYAQEILGTHYSFNDYGNWIDVFNQLMGVKVIDNTNTYYGWVRLSVPFDCSYITVSEYAIDTVANEPIKAGDKCGTYSITVNTMISGPDPLGFCEGSAAILSTDTVSGQTYQWLLDGNIIDGATDYSFNADSAGDYSAIVWNAAGCPDTSNILTIQSFPLPDPPVITQTGNTMSTDEATAYQWYHNGAIISGATDQEYQTNQGGDYTVVITDLNGCTNESAPFAFIPVGISSSDAASLSVFEANNFVFINLYDEKFLGGTIKVFNTVGDEVYSSIVNNKNVQLDLQELSTGMYLLSIEKNSLRFTKKIVID